MIEEGIISPGSIEFTMQIGGGETVGTLIRCLASDEAVPSETMKYINGALGLAVPHEMLVRTWFVDRMDYRRARPPRVRVWLRTSKL